MMFSVKKSPCNTEKKAVSYFLQHSFFTNEKIEMEKQILVEPNEQEFERVHTPRVISKIIHDEGKINDL